MYSKQKQDLDLIQEMILTARREVNENGFMFMLWGWLVFVAALGNFLLLMINYEHSYVPWVLMPVGGIITAIYVTRQKKQTHVKTHIDRVMGHLWLACCVVMAIVMLAADRMEAVFLPCMMLIYGIGTYVTGGALKFKPLRYGGIACWLLAAAAFFSPYSMQLLLIAAAILFSYIIPGHILRKNYNHV